MIYPDRTTPPPVKHFADITIEPERIISLPNGVDIHTVSYGNADISRICLVRDGGQIDYPDQSAALIMAMCQQEGTARMSSNEIADLIDYCGARLGGNMSSHHISLDLITLNSKIERILPVIFDIATEAAFPEKEVGITARRMSASRAMQMERVAYRASTRLISLLQGIDHPASKISTPEELLAVSREDILPLYAQMGKTRLHIYAGGKIDEAVIEKLADTFGRLPYPTLDITRRIPYTPETPRREKIEMPGVKQSAVAMGFPSIPRTNPDYIPLRLTVMALGGYFGSRLMSNIREEKGLTYGINASLSGLHEGAWIEIMAQCDSRYVEQVIDETSKEIRRLGCEPPRGEELKRLKLHAWSQLATATDSVFGTLEHYITQLRVGTPRDYFKQQLKAISSLTEDTIREMAEKYLRLEELSIVVAGD